MLWIIGVTIGVLLSSIGLGMLSDNWFLGYGLAIVVVSSSVSIFLAGRNARSAAKASDLTYESYLPKVDSSESHTFKFTSGIMGMSNNPMVDMRNQIEELQRVAIQDEKNFRKSLEMANYRIGICLAQIRFHEQATLPRLLGQGAGAIILAGVFAIIGSAYLAFPAQAYKGFSSLGQKILALL